MNTTEDWLTGALDAAAETVRKENVRPLAEPRHGVRERRRRWDARFAPAAAAVVVVLVVALALVVTRGTPLRPVSTTPSGGQGAAAQPAPPRYYAEAEGGIYTGSSQIVVRSTATGAVLARIANPPAASGNGTQYAVSVAAGTDDETFYAVYENGNAKDGSIRIYRFHLGLSGTPTALTEIAGGLISGQNYLLNVGGIAVSPDGSQLAVAVAATSSGPDSGTPQEIVVVNLRSGAHSTWRSGLDRAGSTVAIADVSWTGDSKSLVYLAQWCSSDAGEGMTGLTCAGGRTDAQVRALDVASGGGQLNSGPVLLRPSSTRQYIAQALINPAGNEIDVVAQEGSGVEVAEISIATGKTVRVLYRTPFPDVAKVQGWHLAADRTGKYLLVGEGGSGPVHGWIKDGTVRKLPPLAPASNPGVWEGFTW